MRTTLFSVTTVLAVVLIGGCSAESTDMVPTVETDDLDLRDQGTSYNGWTQSISGSTFFYSAYGDWSFTANHTMTRTSGDATRGGGACAVYLSGTSCTNDTPCVTAAQSQFGSTAYGYCYSGTCYLRPGSQANYCALNPNRGPGTLTKNLTNQTGAIVHGAIGCMTKTAGLNAACGGTDSSLYMRTYTSWNISIR
jgi:hypothetical protein